MDGEGNRKYIRINDSLYVDICTAIIIDVNTRKRETRYPSLFYTEGVACKIKLSIVYLSINLYYITIIQIQC